MVNQTTLVLIGIIIYTINEDLYLTFHNFYYRIINMKYLFVINKHSFVDLITNSSSELFVCNTKKTVEMVESLLRKLLETHNELGEMPNAYTFSFNCFSKIEEAKFTYDVDLFDKFVVDIHKSYDECSSHYNFWNEKDSHPSSYYTCNEKEKELSQTHSYYTSPINRKKYEERTKEENDEHSKLWDDYLKKNNVIWTPYGAEKLKAQCDLFIEFLKVNKFNVKDIEKVQELSKKAIEDFKKKKSGKYCDLWFLTKQNRFPKHFNEALEFFREAESWDMTIHKGAIIVRSNGDNSIPYELFELIESYLHARRYHLG